jgi:hypothetical protein
MLLRSFICGMMGEAGKELRFRNPSTLENGLNIATDVLMHVSLNRATRNVS